MHELRLPVSGRTLVGHMAAYGLALVLDNGREDAFVGHDPDSLELDPLVATGAGSARTAELVRASASGCEDIVEADMTPGCTGNDRRPVVWARATRVDRALAAVPMREALLDTEEGRGGRLAVALTVGLGAPAPWASDKPHRGASRLDGVMGNHTSDFVRGALRRSRAAAVDVTAEELTAPKDPAADKTGWSPPGTSVAPAVQWLAALGLGLLPVGLVAHGYARTPAATSGRPYGVTLPILSRPVSVPRLRALLQRVELGVVDGSLVPEQSARLRALGVSEVAHFPKVDRSTPQSVQFFFGSATAVKL